jgi:hypothetical protein
VKPISSRDYFLAWLPFLFSQLPLFLKQFSIGPFMMDTIVATQRMSGWYREHGAVEGFISLAKALNQFWGLFASLVEWIQFLSSQNLTKGTLINSSIYIMFFVVLNIFVYYFSLKFFIKRGLSVFGAAIISTLLIVLYTKSTSLYYIFNGNLEILFMVLAIDQFFEISNSKDLPIKRILIFAGFLFMSVESYKVAPIFAFSFFFLPFKNLKTRLATDCSIIIVCFNQWLTYLKYLSSSPAAISVAPQVSPICFRAKLLELLQTSLGQMTYGQSLIKGSIKAMLHSSAMPTTLLAIALLVISTLYLYYKNLKIKEIAREQMAMAWLSLFAISVNCIIIALSFHLTASFFFYGANTRVFTLGSLGLVFLLFTFLKFNSKLAYALAIALICFSQFVTLSYLYFSHQSFEQIDFVYHEQFSFLKNQISLNNKEDCLSPPLFFTVRGGFPWVAETLYSQVETTNLGLLAYRESGFEVFCNKVREPYYSEHLDMNMDLNAYGQVISHDFFKTAQNTLDLHTKKFQKTWGLIVILKSHQAVPFANAIEAKEKTLEFIKSAEVDKL